MNVHTRVGASTPIAAGLHTVPHAHLFTATLTRGGTAPKLGPNSLYQVARLARSGRKQRQRTISIVMASSVSSDAPSVQLATAKLPPKIIAESDIQGMDMKKFQSRLFSWASTLTSSGQNMPFALPLRTRQINDGFEIALLRIKDGQPMVVGAIQATVEDIVGTGDVLFVRFVEGPGAEMVRSKPLPNDPQERLKVVLDSLVDVPLLMNSMKGAIRQCVSQSGPSKSAEQA